MSEPKHKRICDRLYAYELGLLKGDQLDEFEIHILDCSTCRKEADEFLRTTRIIKHDPEVRGYVQGLDADYHEDSEGALPKLTRKPVRSRHRFFQAALAVAAVAVLLVLQPWNVHIEPEDQAVAADNRLAVMYITDPSGSEAGYDVGRSIAHLLTTDLTDSRFVQVISMERLQDAVRQLGMAGLENVNQTNAPLLAKAVDAKWMLVGKVSTEGGERLVATQLIDVPGGEVVSSQELAADSAQSLFEIVDRLSVQVKAAMNLPDGALKEEDRLVADVTTHSAEAYRYYLQGLEFSNKVYTEEATIRFGKAIELDSSFAMAYYQLSLSAYPHLIGNAVVHSKHATSREQLFILSRHAMLTADYEEAFNLLESLVKRHPDEKEAIYRLGILHYQSGNFAKAAGYFRKALRLDPSFRMAQNHLAYALDEAGSYQEALSALDEYAEIAPNEANPHDSRGDILATHGQLDQASEAYGQALKIKPDFEPSALKLYYCLMHKGRYLEAEAFLDDYTEDTNTGLCSRTQTTRARMLAYRGRYRDALAVLDEGIDACEQANKTFGHYDVLAPMYWLRASLLMELGESGLDEIESAISTRYQSQPADSASYRVTYASALRRSGQPEKARKVLADLKVHLKTRDPWGYLYLLGTGLATLDEGDTDAAIDALTRAANARAPRLQFEPRFWLGTAYLRAGDPETAVKVFGSIVASYPEFRMRQGHLSAQLIYNLGVAYEESGRPDEAALQFDTFLKIWKDADADLPQLQDARNRLADLRAH